MEILPLFELTLLALALAMAGLVTGFLAGLLGIGGGGMLAPVLYEVFGALGVEEAARMHLAVGTSLAAMVPTTMRSFAAHRARGSVDLDFVRRYRLPILAGVMLGIIVAGYASGTALKLIWIVAGTLLALRLYLGRDDWRLGKDIPNSRLVEAYLAVVGFLSTLMSTGGGALISMLMTLYGRSILQAVSTSSGAGPLIAIPGALGFVWAGWGASGLPPGSLGYVSLLGILVIVPASVFAAPWGVRLAHGLPRRHLELAFATFLMVIAMRFLWTLL
ncbi:MAG TPA: sulfite exporter TauE/SafE family protein [Hyphomicrobiaceae bacterium]|nr:sulfite exporter TauE/SafE family protein [Hyphomicrobiaceae bacterium]